MIQLIAFTDMTTPISTPASYLNTARISHITTVCEVNLTCKNPNMCLKRLLHFTSYTEQLYIVGN